MSPTKKAFISELNHLLKWIKCMAHNGYMIVFSYPYKPQTYTHLLPLLSYIHLLQFCFNLSPKP